MAQQKGKKNKKSGVAPPCFTEPMNFILERAFRRQPNALGGRFFFFFFNSSYFLLFLASSFPQWSAGKEFGSRGWIVSNGGLVEGKAGP